MPLARVTNAASIAGHVSRAPAGWFDSLLMWHCGPQPAQGLRHGHFGEIARARSDLRLSKGSILRRAHGEDQLLVSLYGSFYGKAAEAPIPDRPRRHLSGLGGARALACQIGVTSQSSYTKLQGCDV